MSQMIKPVIEGRGTRTSTIIYVNPSTAGAVRIRFLHFLLAHYMSAFKPVNDKN